MLKMCMNWKVLAGLAAVGAGIWVFAPNLIGAALPLLFLAACPLSMLFMMKGMGNKASRSAQQDGVAGHYTCPMHRDVHSDQPGRCPACGMNLAPAAPARPVHAARMDGAGTAGNREAELAELRAQLRGLNEQQATLARQVERLEAAEAPVVSSNALQEAEQVARTADSRL